MHGPMLLLALWPVLQVPAAGERVLNTVDGKAKLRAYQQINQEVRGLLQREARATNDAERAAAVFQMTRLYGEIRRDPRLPTSPTLNQYKARLWGRMTKVKNDINKQLARQRRLGGGANQAVADQTAHSLAEGLSMVGESLGGPASVFAQSGAWGGRAGPPDWGPALVALIERTISPEFWDVHGGPGTIFYYRPLHVLVVRATSEVHHSVGGLLGDIRDAGR